MLVSRELEGVMAGARLYNLAGELIAGGEDPGRRGRFEVQARSELASGAYVLVFEQRAGGSVIRTRVIKMAVVR